MTGLVCLENTRFFFFYLFRWSLQCHRPGKCIFTPSKLRENSNLTIKSRITGTITLSSLSTYRWVSNHIACFQWHRNDTTINVFFQNVTYRFIKVYLVFIKKSRWQELRHKIVINRWNFEWCLN